MTEAFAAGGWGMFPTLLAGVGLLVASVLYARRPEARYVPLMVTCLGAVSFRGRPASGTSAVNGRPRDDAVGN